jgi:CheY-like chemotaxis protein
LIVDDAYDAAHSLQQALVLEGHDVEIAPDGKTGLELVLAFDPDVVLCDLGLPDIDGFAFALQVKTLLRSSAYLVALTGYARVEDVAQAKAAGFDFHLAKPASLDEIARVLENTHPLDEPPGPKTLH